MISAIIPHFYKERVANLPLIVDSFCDSVDEVIIWNNDSPIPPIPGVRIIQSERNLGCQGRFEAVKHLSRGLCGTDYILFHDNDLVGSKHSVRRLLDAAQGDPGCIYSATGEQRVFDGRVIPISRGRIELVSAEVAGRILHYWKNDERSIHDDIWFSVTGYHLGVPVKFVNIAWKNINLEQEKQWGIGFWRTPGFFPERERMFNQLMQEGLQ